MGRLARAIRFAAGVILLLAASASFAADRSPAGPARRPREAPQKRDGAAPSPRGERKGAEVRLDAMKIVGRLRISDQRLGDAWACPQCGSGAESFRAVADKPRPARPPRARP